MKLSAFALTLMLVLGIGGVATADHYGATTRGSDVGHGYVVFRDASGVEVVRYVDQRPRGTCLSWGSFVPVEVDNHSDRMISMHNTDACTPADLEEPVYPGELDVPVGVDSGAREAVIYW